MALAIRQFDDIVPPFAVELKHCPRCERDLPLSEYGICRARKDGLNLYCKRCIREKIKLSRQALKEYRSVRLRHVRSSRVGQASAIHSPRYNDDVRFRLSRHVARLLRAGPPGHRVLEAIKRGHHTQRDIARVTKLSKDEVCDAIANLLLWTGEIRTEKIHSLRMYFINAERHQPTQEEPRKALNPSFSSIGILMPGAKPANQRRKTA